MNENPIRRRLTIAWCVGVLMVVASAYYFFHSTQGTQNRPSSVTVKIEGMSCTGCEPPIKSALERTAGVRSADVSYERGDARVKYDPNATDLEKIKHAIDSTGFKAK